MVFFAKLIKADRKEVIVKYVLENGFVTNKKARELLGLADSTTKRVLKEMVDEGILIMEGERKARKYLLVEALFLEYFFEILDFV